MLCDKSRLPEPVAVLSKKNIKRKREGLEKGRPIFQFGISND